VVTAELVAPRFCWVPPHTDSRGEEAVEFCREHGLVLDEWQALVLKDSLNLRADGRWAAFEVGVNVSRQNGKGGIIEGRELTGIFLFGERLITHSAHQFDTSMEAFMRMEEILEESDLHKQLKPKGGVVRSHGAEGFVFESGQRIRYRTRTKGGGRGFSGDCLILDEDMILPEFSIGALLPTLSAKSITGNPQVWYLGSAVDQQVHEDGVVAARIRERGIRGYDPSLAYFEWSAPQPKEKEVWVPDQVDDEYLETPENWRLANPALGIRISEEHVENELRSMGRRTFAVERLGIGDWPATDANALAIEGWEDLEDPDSVLVDPVCLAFDVSPDRAWASIGAAGARPDGLAHIEVIENRRGTGWVVARLVELRNNHRPLAIIGDGASPASALIPALEEAGVEVLKASARDQADACGVIFDYAKDAKLRHLGTKELRDALKGAAKRPLGDAWAWSRKNSTVDISPLVACTLALWGFSTHQRTGEFMPDVGDLFEQIQGEEEEDDLL